MPRLALRGGGLALQRAGFAAQSANLFQRAPRLLFARPLCRHAIDFNGMEASIGLKRRAMVTARFVHRRFLGPRCRQLVGEVAGLRGRARLGEHCQSFVGLRPIAQHASKIQRAERDDALVVELLAEREPVAQESFRRREIADAVIKSAQHAEAVRHLHRVGRRPRTLQHPMGDSQSLGERGRGRRLVAVGTRLLGAPTQQPREIAERAQVPARVADRLQFRDRRAKRRFSLVEAAHRAESAAHRTAHRGCRRAPAVVVGERDARLQRLQRRRRLPELEFAVPDNRVETHRREVVTLPLRESIGCCRRRETLAERAPV